jgi:signal transduction histidine kinase
LRELTGRLLEAQETERRRIARELHDDFNQRLALLAVELDLMGQVPPAPHEVGPRMRELAGQARRISSSAHALAHQLHPAKLEQLGLVAALRGLCKELTHAHGLPIGFTHDGVPEPLPDAVALCVYRIAQEAVRNVLRHSGATCCEVDLTGGEAGVRLSVVDDGTGFDPREAAGKGGMGLMSIRERLRLVGGEMDLEASPGGGTRVRVRVPVAGPGAAG